MAAHRIECGEDWGDADGGRRAVGLLGAQRGGLQTEHGECCAAASESETAMALFARYRQPARWYLVPVFVT